MKRGVVEEGMKMVKWWLSQRKQPLVQGNRESRVG